LLNQEYLHPKGGRPLQDNLSEDDISVKFITPAIVKVGWDEATQIRRQVSGGPEEGPQEPVRHPHQ